MQTRLTKLIGTCIAALVTLAAAHPRQARAEDNFNLLLDETDRSYQLYQLKNDHDELRVGRSKSGVILSTVTSSIALAFLGAGAAGVAQSNRALDDWGFGRAFGTIYLATGAAVLVPSVIGLAVSSKHFKESKHKRAELEERIRALEAENQRVYLENGPPQRAALVRF